MTSNDNLSAHDLRGPAVDYQRERQHKSKWALGETRGPGQIGQNGKTKPMRMHQGANASDRKYLAKEVHKERIARKLPRLADDGLQSDSSAEEDVEEASAAPEPDAEITYSYDAAHGPGQGSQILSVAVAQAVERFENHATDKLVKEEYEVLDNEDEAVATNMARKGRHGVAEEDEYEFV